MQVSSAAREAALAFLYKRINYERSPRIPYQERHFKLDRMRQLLAQLGNPHHNVPTIHIAGTKGKGSTAAFLASMLTAAGYRTGVYTSPHLDRLEERFVVDRQQCTEAELVELVRRVRSVVEAGKQDVPQSKTTIATQDAEARATYFELTTAMAFLHFQSRQVDVAILEVGLGGRLDSTNVCRPMITVITSISFDHQAQLGATLPQIAAEKAGIIKPGIPVICGVREPSARNVIRRRAEELGCPLRLVDEDYGYRFRWLERYCQAAESSLTGPHAIGSLDYWERTADESPARNDLRLGLLGEHQARNAASSLAVVGELRRGGWKFAEQAVRQGLAEASCPARVEVVGNSPMTIIDAAHNVASCQALVDTLKAAFPQRQKTLLFATSQDKDAAGMLRVLLPHFQQVVLTRYRNNPRSADPTELVAQSQRILAERAGTLGERAGTRGDGAGTRGDRAIERCVVLEPDPKAAWQMVRSSARPADVLCVTGSFFLAAELRRLIMSPSGASPSGDSSVDGFGRPPRV